MSRGGASASRARAGFVWMTSPTGHSWTILALWQVRPGPRVPDSLSSHLIERHALVVAGAVPFPQPYAQALLHAGGRLPAGQGPKHWPANARGQLPSTTLALPSQLTPPCTLHARRLCPWHNTLPSGSDSLQDTLPGTRHQHQCCIGD